MKPPYTSNQQQQGGILTRASPPTFLTSNQQQEESKPTSALLTPPSGGQNHQDFFSITLPRVSPMSLPPTRLPPPSNQQQKIPKTSSALSPPYPVSNRQKRVRYHFLNQQKGVRTITLIHSPPLPTSTQQQGEEILTPNPLPPYSTFIKVINRPAKHLGHIRILELNSPQNANAISWWLLRQLQREINLVRAQGDLRNRNGTATRSDAPATKDKGSEKNASSKAVLERLGPTRVLIIASRLDVFCAGADLKERAEMTNSQ